MCVSAFVFGEFILLSVQPVAVATPVVKTHCSRSRVSVLRIGFAVYAFNCALFPTTPAMSAPAKTPTFIKDEDFTFSGDHIKEWFRFDRIVERYSKRKYHKIGPQLWNDSAIPIDAQTVDALSQGTYGNLPGLMHHASPSPRCIKRISASRCIIRASYSTSRVMHGHKSSARASRCIIRASYGASQGASKGCP